MYELQVVEKTRKFIIDKSHIIAKYYELLTIGHKYDIQAHTVANSPTRAHIHNLYLYLTLSLTHTQSLSLSYTHIYIITLTLTHTSFGQRTICPCHLALSMYFSTLSNWNQSISETLSYQVLLHFWTGIQTASIYFRIRKEVGGEQTVTCTHNSSWCTLYSIILCLSFMVSTVPNYPRDDWSRHCHCHA